MYCIIVYEKIISGYVIEKEAIIYLFLALPSIYKHKTIELSVLWLKLIVPGGRDWHKDNEQLILMISILLDRLDDNIYSNEHKTGNEIELFRFGY